jgi:hypothetical protein
MEKVVGVDGLSLAGGSAWEAYVECDIYAGYARV